MEKDRLDWMGKLIISVHERIPRGTFSLSVLEGDRLVPVYMGSFSELGDSFAANGEARALILSGINIYFLYNPLDLQDKDIRQSILPPGMDLNF